MDDVIERVREYAKNLANNGAPHQIGIGRDILQVVSAAASAAVTNAAIVSAASGAKALRDELDDVRGQLVTALEENKRLAQAVADAAAENVTLRETSAENAQLQAALDVAMPHVSEAVRQQETQGETGASKVQRRKAKG